MFPDHAFKYLSSEVAINILIEPTIKFNTPDNYNDPFDCNPDLIEYNITREFIDEQIKAKVLKLSDHELNLNDPELFALVGKLYNEKDSNIYRGLNMTRNNTWLSCLSKNYNSILMWSHYSNSHRGICIGYDFNKLANHFKYWNTEVSYLKEFEKADYCEDSSYAMKHMISCKSKEWEYEEEVRIYTNREHADLGKNGIIKISKECISHIILGMRYNVSNFKESMIKLGYEHAKFIKLQKSDSRFALDELVL